MVKNELPKGKSNYGFLFFAFFFFPCFLGAGFVASQQQQRTHSLMTCLPFLLLLLLRGERLSSSSSFSSLLLLLRAPCLSAIKHLPESCLKWSVRALLACLFSPCLLSLLAARLLCPLLSLLPRFLLSHALDPLVSRIIPWCSYSSWDAVLLTRQGFVTREYVYTPPGLFSACPFVVRERSA